MTEQTWRIERLGHRGDGIAAGPVYVAGALPGELVTGRPEGERLRDVRIVSPVAERVAPPCGHAGACGGCALQHARDDFVGGWKMDVVRRALADRGLAAPIAGLSVSPPSSRRRAVLHGRRTRKGALVGLMRRGTDALVAVPGCRVLRPGLLALVPALEDLTRAGASRSGVLDIALTETRGGIDVAVRGGKPLDRDLALALAGWAAAAGVARLSWDGETVVTLAPPVVDFAGIAVVPPPGAFLQATAEGEAALRRAAVRAVGPAPRLADLFAGCGTFALPLAAGAAVHAVEGDAAMLAALDDGWRGGSGMKRVTTEARDLFRRPLEPEELARFDAVVLDPPRSGAEAQCRRLASGGVPVIAMLSCNPASFARDAAILAQGGYAIDWIEIVDQFRWSPHIELAARLSLGHTAGD